MDKENLSLKRVHAEERHGFVWVMLSEEHTDVGSFLEGIDQELGALQMDDMVVVAEHTSVRKANWKMLIEGGIEAIISKSRIARPSGHILKTTCHHTGCMARICGLSFPEQV